MLLSRSGEIRKVAPLLRFRFWMEGMLEKLSVGCLLIIMTPDIYKLQKGPRAMKASSRYSQRCILKIRSFLVLLYIREHDRNRKTTSQCRSRPHVYRAYHARTVPGCSR